MGSVGLRTHPHPASPIEGEEDMRRRRVETQALSASSEIE
jgi:hypothetical protein